MLVSVRHGKARASRYCSLEHGRSRRSSTAPWISPSRSLFPSVFACVSTALPPRTSCAPPRALPWPESAYRRRAAPPLRHARRRAPFRAPPVPVLGASGPPRCGEPLVVTSPLVSSPAAKAGRSATAPARLRLTRGPGLATGPAWQHLWVHCTGCT